MSTFSLVIHGGYGGQKHPPRQEFLKKLLHEGHALLKSGRSSLEVVQAMIERLEDSGLFNAGKGSVSTSLKTFEADAAIMDGSTLRAGAVAMVSGVKNPIRLARAVFDKKNEVLLVGPATLKLARALEHPLVDADYFSPTPLDEPEHFGTVGCVALDRQGRLAAGTSTGGTRNKPEGRVGDSPLIGSGTYANNATCAVSATGKGELFILANAAHTVSCLMEYGGQNLPTALNTSLKNVEVLGGTGGMISVDRQGQIAFSATLPELLCAGAILEDGREFYP